MAHNKAILRDEAYGIANNIITYMLVAKLKNILLVINIDFDKIALAYQN